MKFFHLADLHLGKRVNEIPMLDEQRHVLEQILAAARQEKPQAVLIAGDVYDKSVPPAEAVQLCDWFLTELAAEAERVLIIPGNHDSAERLAFGAGVLEAGGVHIARPFAGEVERVRLADEAGAVDFWLLPFIRPAVVRRLWPEEQFADYNAAVGFVMRRLKPEAPRNVLLAHQLITGSQTCDSEELAVGGLDNVDAGWFADFDYVALGHLHGAQQAGRPQVRYCGSPLKYSFSEAAQQKGLAVVELAADGTADVRLLPLLPLHDMREEKGPFARLLAMGPSEDYLHCTLTDEEDVLDALPRLRALYPNLMKLDYDNRRTREQKRTDLAVEAESKSPLELFAAFYELQNNQSLGTEQTALLRRLIDEIWEGE